MMDLARVAFVVGVVALAVGFIFGLDAIMTPGDQLGEVVVGGFLTGFGLIATAIAVDAR